MKLNFNYFASILFFYFTGCSTAEQAEIDPFSEISYGEISFTDAQAKFLADPRFNKPKYDSTEFQFFFNHLEMKLPVTIELNPDDYNFGSLREIRIELDGDTVYYIEPEYWPGNGPRLKSEIDFIVKKYERMYGPPDSIHTYIEEVNDFDLFPLDIATAEARANITPANSINSELDTIKEKSLIWEFDNYVIDLYLPKPYADKYQNNLPVYRGSRILYSMKNYDQTYKAIQDSIREALVPNEIVSIDLGVVKWASTDKEGERKIDIEIKGFSRKAQEITKGFRALRYDIKIVDQFNKTIGEINDLTYEFDETVLRPPEGALTFYMSTPHLITTYNVYSSNYTSLEKARQYAQNFKVRAVADVKGIVLGGGEIIE